MALLEQEIGPDDLQRSLPTSASLAFLPLSSLHFASCLLRRLMLSVLLGTEAKSGSAERG